MNQSFETQLTVALRALGEVVLPALDGAEKHVVEQLHLSMVGLNFIRQQLPHAHSFYRRELVDHMALAKSAAELIGEDDRAAADELCALAEAGREVLDDATADWGEQIAATRRLRAAIAAAVEASAERPYEPALDALVLKVSADLHVKARRWVVSFGFEQHPES